MPNAPSDGFDIEPPEVGFHCAYIDIDNDAVGMDFAADMPWAEVETVSDPPVEGSYFSLLESEFMKLKSATFDYLASRTDHDSRRICKRRPIVALATIKDQIPFVSEVFRQIEPTYTASRP